VDRAGVLEWVAAYERAWRAQDADAVATLFTEDVRYLRSPYEPPLDGHAAVRDFWPDPTPFTMEVGTAVAEGPDAVVRVLVRYGGDQPQEYTDLWVLRFADDGRVRHFEEWAYWPGRAYSAGQDPDPTPGG
jgi:ketosteroid isomerase-like protein